MTITLSLKDEEHIIIVEPGDDLIDILTGTLGNLDYYLFYINNEEIASVDLSKRLYNDITIDVVPHTRGLASVNPVIGPRGYTLEIKSLKNPKRPIIKIETIHISCSSDLYHPSKDMAGLIVYSYDDQLNFHLNGHHCQTGYILIKETANIDHVKSNQGLVHGKLFKWFFGIEPDQRFIGGGFAFQNGKLKFNSMTFNARNDDYHDTTKAMHQHEIDLIRYAFEQLYKNHSWKRCQTIPVYVINEYKHVHWNILRLQNRPK
jgi:hypothetical protein